MDTLEHASEKAAALPVHNKVSFFEHVAVSYATDVGKENAASNPKLEGYTSPASATDSGSDMSSIGSPKKTSTTIDASDEVSRLKARISHLQSTLKKGPLSTNTTAKDTSSAKLTEESHIQSTLPDFSSSRSSPKVSKSTRKYRYFQRGENRRSSRETIDSTPKVSGTPVQGSGAPHGTDRLSTKASEDDDHLPTEETMEMSKAKMGMIVLRSKLEEKEACIAEQAEQLAAANMNAEEMVNTVLSLEREMTAQASRLKSETQMANRRVNELERKLKAANEATASLEALISKSESALDSTADNMKTDLSMLHNKLRHSEESVEISKNELLAAKTQIEEHESTNAVQRDALEKSESRVAELEGEVEKLKFELDKQTQILQSARVNEQAVAAAKAEVAVLTKRMAQKEKDMNATLEKYKVDSMAAQAEAQRWAQAAAASAAAAAATGAAQLSQSGSKEQKKAAKALNLFMRKHGPEGKTGA